MPGNYANPLGALPQPTDYNFHGPFGISMPTALSYQAGATQRQTAEPFLQQNFLENQMGLARQATDLGEYTGPEATQQRSLLRQKDIAQSQSDLQTIPLKGTADRLALKKDIELLPLKTQAEKEELNQHMIALKGQPAGNAMDMMAAMYPEMKGKSPLEQQAMHGELVKQFQAKYPGQPLPAPLATFNPANYQVAHSAVVHNAQFQRDAEIQTQKDTAAMQRTRVEAGATVQAAGMHLQGVREQIAAARTPEQSLSVGREALKKTKPEERPLIEQQIDQANAQIVEGEADKLFEKLSPMNMIMEQQRIKQQLMSQGVPEAQANAQAADAAKNYLAQRQNWINQRLMERGVTMSYLRRKNPGMNDDELRKQAKQRNIQVIE